MKDCVGAGWTVQTAPSALCGSQGQAGAVSFFSLVFAALWLLLGDDTLIEEQVGAGGQDLLQACPSDCVIRDPQPLAAGGQRVLG